LIDDAIYLRRLNHADTFIMKREHISLRGEHNLLNVMQPVPLPRQLVSL